ncbi:hypothetical protein [Microbacterium sp. VKM Ac-2923]|uniref:hypothetical protein n=1 Tax=Microbacterium sp. VKM Ac-2923 TaxID=2929476 RepID=UPI001FB473E8|nr:hypothetical protein [Microbacterium sp. VKM Ac-2923]MCJ1709284.1 hypothetical protein [Microbacterium sp. VKM Ac-2923]
MTISSAYADASHISREGDRIVIIDAVTKEAGESLDIIIGPQAELALSELFRAETDKNLGRWRWPTDPDYVVYAFGLRDVKVLRESTGASRSFTTDELTVPSAMRDAARAYFDAHPEKNLDAPKPWHKATLGDVWVMGPLNVAYTVVGGVDSGSWFTRADVFGKVEKRDLTDDVFTTGTLIWRGIAR